MLEARTFFPRERAPILSEVSFTIKALVEGIKKRAIKYFIEAFKQFKVMLEN